MFVAACILSWEFNSQLSSCVLSEFQLHKWLLYSSGTLCKHDGMTYSSHWSKHKNVQSMQFFPSDTRQPSRDKKNHL